MNSPKQANEQALETRNIAIRADLHRQLKALAASQGMSLRSLVERAIMDSVGENPLSRLSGASEKSTETA